MFKDDSSEDIALHSELEACWKEVARLHDELRLKGHPESFLLLGVSGLGKSSFQKCYQAQHRRKKCDSVLKMPVAYFKVPSSPTPKSLMQSINRMFEGPDTGTTPDLMRRAAKYVSHFGVEVLFVDEAHHMIDRGRIKTHAHLGDCWKEFHDQIHCIVGMCGAPRLKLLLETNNQLRNRFAKSIALHPFSYDTSDLSDLGSFVAVMIAANALSADERVLLDGDVLLRMQFATDGVPAHIVRLLRETGRRKLLGEEVNLHLLDQAWELPGTGRLHTRRRPFHANFDFERLKGIDEPFFPSTFDGDNHADYA